VKFDLALEITPSEYRASSNRAGYEFVGPTVCMTEQIRGSECFLSIGEDESAFQGDVEFLRLKSSGELRIFNPFTPDRFEPENAASVVYSYVLQAHRQLRKAVPSMFRPVLLGRIDRCVVGARISGWDSIAAQLRDRFCSQVRGYRSVASFTANNL
jgi:hypothetical protein